MHESWVRLGSHLAVHKGSLAPLAMSGSGVQQITSSEVETPTLRPAQIDPLVNRPGSWQLERIAGEQQQQQQQQQQQSPASRLHGIETLG